MTNTIDAGNFYEEYHGHPISLLKKLHASLGSSVDHNSFVFLAGDSSFDNKHWFFAGHRAKADQMEAPLFTAPALNGYEMVFEEPGRMVQDVSYWLNHEAEARLGRTKVCTMMTAVEESTMRDRESGLLAQDAFIREHITPADSLVRRVRLY